MAVPAPVMPSRFVQTSSWWPTAVPPAVMPTETTRPSPSPSSTSASDDLAAHERTAWRRSLPHSVSSAVRRLSIQPRPVSATPTRPITPTAARWLMAVVDGLAQGLAEAAGRLLGDVVEQLASAGAVEAASTKPVTETPSRISGNSARKLK